jgi:hypothetical protein
MLAGGHAPNPYHIYYSLFKNIPSIELLKLEEALFITDPNAKIIRDIQAKHQDINQYLNHVKQSLLLGVFGAIHFLQAINSSQQPHQTNIQPILTQPIRTLYRILELQIFPGIINGIPAIPRNTDNQLLSPIIQTNHQTFDVGYTRLGFIRV